MERGYSASRSGRGRSSAAGRAGASARSGRPAGERGRPSSRPARYRSQQPHHRRRRRNVSLALVAGLLLIVILASTGGTRAMHAASAQPAGFFSRIQTLAGSGSGSFIAAERAAEGAGIDRVLNTTPYVVTAGAQHREIALTFDDGPGPYTPRVLSVLQQLNVPGTFFTVGAMEQYFHASTSQEVADGYPIEDHTQDHAPMSKLGATEQESQLLREASAAGSYGAAFPRLFRPPYGYWNQETLALTRKYRMLMVLWTIDTEDYKQPGVDTILHTVLRQAKPGAIVLMHDAGGTRTQTIEALPLVVRALRARGYKLVTLPRLLLDNPPAAADQRAAAGGGGG